MAGDTTIASRYERQVEEDKWQCLVCPHNCILGNQEVGRCHIRRADETGINLAPYNSVTSVAVEPIEKKPLYHYRPGCKVLSVGMYGCSFRCVYCENFVVSQAHTFYGEEKKTEELVNMAHENGCGGIVMTYNEPIVCFEYLMELAEAAHNGDLFFGIKTNGFAEREPWDEICSVTDVMNIDFKANNQQSHAGITNVDPRAFYTVVTRLAEAFVHKHLHIELSIPVVEEDAFSTYDSTLDFLCHHNKNIPVHIFQISPAYDAIDRQMVKTEYIFELWEYLKRRLSFVYIQKLFGEGNEARKTICPSCGNTIVSRTHLDVSVSLNKDCRVCSSVVKLNG